jgi:hypothetical protein
MMPQKNPTARIHECQDLRNRRRVTQDRFDAGQILSRMLEQTCGGAEDTFLLAFPWAAYQWP